jgi:hypothetical protein
MPHTVMTSCTVRAPLSADAGRLRHPLTSLPLRAAKGIDRVLEQNGSGEAGERYKLVRGRPVDRNAVEAMADVGERSLEQVAIVACPNRNAARSHAPAGGGDPEPPGRGTEA